MVIRRLPSGSLSPQVDFPAAEGRVDAPQTRLFECKEVARRYPACYNFCMNTLKVTQIGNSLGVVLPKEIVARLKLQRGDVVHVTDSPEGIVLTPYDPTLDEQVQLGREFMREYRDTFRQLAK